jgi:ribosomal-protein-alanine N-acetyltransferase
LSFSPAVEIGWRLDNKYWYKGYVSEAAKKSLEFAFDTLNLAQVFSYTAKMNKPLEKVMQRIGMLNTDATFCHPKVEKGNLLREHLLYRINHS